MAITKIFGGYGSLWVNHDYNDLVSGVVLLSPYLGKKPVIKEIESAGSVYVWRSELDREPGIDDEVWLWIDDLNKHQLSKIQSIILSIIKKDRAKRHPQIFNLQSSIFNPG